MPARSNRQRELTDFIKHARLTWHNGQPFSDEFDDVYFSRDQGVAETEHVFIANNELPDAWLAQSHYCIGETGFGSGLNFIVTVQRWLDSSASDATLAYYSVEKYPLSKADLQQALSLYPQFQSVIDALLEIYPPAIGGMHWRQMLGGRVTLLLIFDDVLPALSQLEQPMQAWYLDGFAPSKNPHMWSDAVFAEIARLSVPDTTLSTYTAAGFVRRGLAEQGFAMEKVPGFGGKRDMLRGRLQSGYERSRSIKPWFAAAPAVATDKHVLVIGAGIAGVTTACALARRGWRVTLIDQHSAPAQAASGNPLGVVMPCLSLRSSTETQFHYAAFALAVSELQRLSKNYPQLDWQPSGVAQLVSSPRIEKQLREGMFDEALVRSIDATELSQLTGLDLQQPALWFPLAGYLNPQDVCRCLLDEAAEAIVFIPDTEVKRFQYAAGQWQLFDTQDRCCASAAHVVIANGHQLGEFSQTAWMAPTPVRGQLSYLPQTEPLDQLRCPVCYDGYVLPARDGRQLIGASFHPGDDSTEPAQHDHQLNMQALRQVMPEMTHSLTIEQGRVAVRAATDDRLPLVGAVADIEYYQTHYADLARGRKAEVYPPGRYLPGLYVNVGHGARGLSTAWLAAEMLTADINQQVSPVYPGVQDALHSARFLIRALKKGRSIHL